MIRTLTLNPAVDKAVVIDRFAVGQVNRIASVRLDAGGKGLNVARVLHHLGAEVVAVAPVGGATGRFLDERLSEEGIPHHFVAIAGESRTNLKVVDPVFDTHTDINEPGPALTEDDLADLENVLLEGLGPGDWVVFSGSLPSSVPKALYAQWMTKVHAQGAKAALDAEGEALTLGLASRPDLIKPNRAELETWTGRALNTTDDLFDAVEGLRAAGARTVAVSLGSEGAWLFHGEGAWHAPGLRVQAESTVGAGDALVAGLVRGLSLALPPADVLAQAVATATASVVRPGTGAGDPEDIATFLARVAVRYQTFSGRKP